jgi:hypothetical protein
MELDRIAFTEHLAARSDLELIEACRLLAEGLGLPPFLHDAENETAWGLVEVDGVELNVSKPYEEGKLREWDHTVPPECNFGIMLMVSKDHPAYPDHERAMELLVPTFAQRIADALGAEVYHHRLWLGPHRTVPQAGVFRPRPVGRRGDT